MNDLLEAESYVCQWKQWKSTKQLEVGFVTGCRSRRLNSLVSGTNDVRVNEIPGGVVASVKRVVQQKMRPDEFVVECRVPVGSAPTGSRTLQNYG